MYFKNANKVFDDNPIIIVKLVLPQFENLVCSNLVDSWPVCHYKPHHVICRIPPGHDVAGNEPFLEINLTAAVFLLVLAIDRAALNR